MNVDPDGLSFFTEGTDVGGPPAGSVFGAMPEGHLDRMLSMEGSEEIGSRYLPDSASPEGEGESSRHIVAVPDHPIVLHPTLTRGTPEWRLDFVLNGPSSPAPSVPGRRLRLISGYRGTPEGKVEHNSSSAGESGGEEES